MTQKEIIVQASRNECTSTIYRLEKLLPVVLLTVPWAQMGFIQKDEMFSSQLTRTASHCGRKALWPCVSEMTETIHVQNSTNHLNILGVHEYFTLTGGF